MKKMVLLVAVAIVGLAAGCATVPPKVIERGIFPRAAAVSAKVVFYQDVKVAGGTAEFIGERNDGVSSAALAAFKKEFREQLSAQGIGVAAVSLVNVEIKLAYVLTKPDVLSEVRWITGEALVYVAGARDAVLVLQYSAGVPLFLPALALGGPEVAARRAAKMVAERFADELAKRLK